MNFFKRHLPQVVCLCLAIVMLWPSWGPSTALFERVVGICWLSFILGIFAAQPSPPKHAAAGS